MIVERSPVPAVTLRVSYDCSAVELCGRLRLSRRAMSRAFEEGLLTRKGERLSRDSRLFAGEVVELALRRTRAVGPVSPAAAEVVWRDDFALVANKPSGLLVHSDGTLADTLTARVRHSLELEAREGSAAVAPGPAAISGIASVQAVNRLDVETSGLVLFSLTEEFQPAFDELVSSHDATRIRKRYLCAVKGRLPSAVVRLDGPVARDRHDARRMRVGRTGKPSLTLAWCVAHADGVSLVACELRSGRRHQIRVHLADAGWPILGDEVYGGPRHRDGLMLHAYGLAFEHPVTEERIVLHTDWPRRFAKLFPPTDLNWSILDP